MCICCFIHEWKEYLNARYGTHKVSYTLAQLASYILRVVLQDEVSRPPRLEFLWMKKLLFLIIFFAPPVSGVVKKQGIHTPACWICGVPAVIAYVKSRKWKVSCVKLECWYFDPGWPFDIFQVPSKQCYKHCDVSDGVIAMATIELSRNMAHTIN